MRTRALAAFAAMLLAAAPAFADLEAQPTLGFDGRWVVDAATPLRVALANSGAEPISVAISVSEGGMMGSGEVVHRRFVQIAAGNRRDELFLVPGPQSWRGGVSVLLETDPEVPIHAADGKSANGSLTIPIGEFDGNVSEGGVPYAARIIGVVGDLRGSMSARLRGLGFSNAGSRGDATRLQIEAMTVAPDLLRLAPLGLEALDAIVLIDPDAQTLADPAALEGVLDWVALGGTLVVSLGEHAATVRSSPLAAHLPATWTSPQRTSYTSLADVLYGSREGGETEGPWTALTENELAADEAVPVHEGGPVRVVRKFGMGRIVVLPFDLRTAVSATGLDEQQARKLLDPIVETSHEPAAASDENDWNWRNNYSTAIARVLQGDAFDPPPLPLVVIGIVLYVLVVGPIDWFVLKKLRKERLTTFTFLGAAAAFTLLAYGASMFLFATGARVTRVVFADLADAGGSGRQVLRFTDILGCYSPTGSDQELRYTQPAVVVRGSLPGSMMGDAGAALPVQVVANDPLRPDGVVPIKFRSQRVTRVNCAGTLGSTIDVEWSEGGGVRVTNGLSVDLDDVLVYVAPGTVYRLGAVKSGATSKGGEFETTRGAPPPPSYNYNSFGDRDSPPTAAEVRALLEVMSTGVDAAPRSSNNSDALKKSGIERSDAFSRGHALVVAHASSFPLPLPGADAEGATYVVIRKEVSRP